MPPNATILLTRPDAAARRFGAALRAAGCTAPQVIAPVLEIRPVPGALAAAPLTASGASGVILTSANAVAAFVAQSPLHPPAWCVGQFTARAARAEGFAVQAAADNADGLFRLMLAAAATGPFLHARGRHARGALADRLTAAGLPTTEVVVYDQIARPPGPEADALLQGTAPVIVPLFSPRSARLLAEAAKAVSAPLHLVAISNAAARGWTDMHGQLALASLRIARRPDADAMIEATLSAAQGTPPLEQTVPSS